ncbi:MAG TPA: Gfo/Idh/MocA family oxidoreductase, partial [Armatimonadota bacterium]|nr:Gfo/Idh/MocA family oxidoreductase [Armatimonadota bacterium]
TLAEAERVAELASAKGTLVQVGFVMRFAPAYTLLKEIISSEDFRQPSLLRLTYCTRGTGGLHELLAHGGLHMVDLVRYLMGDIAALSASRSARTGRASVAVSMRMESGAVGVLAMTSGQPRTREAVEVFADGSWAAVRGRVDLTWQTRSMTRPGEAMTWGPDLSTHDVGGSSGHVLGYLPALEHFAATVRGEAEPAATIHDAVAAMRVAERIERGEGELVQIG